MLGKLRKWVLLLVIACMAASAVSLTGCSKGEEEPKNGSTPANEATPDSSLPPVKLSWYLFGVEGKDDKAVHQEASKMIKEKINADVEFVKLSGSDYQDKMQLKIAASEEFDICFTSNWRLSYYNNATQGAYVEVDSLIDQYGPDLKKVIPQYIIDGAKIGGKMYGIPNYQISVSQNALVFQKELVDKYNLKEKIDSVKEMKDLSPILEVIKQNEPDIIPANEMPAWRFYDQYDPEKYLLVGSAGYMISVDKDLNVHGPMDEIIKNKMMADAKLSREWNQKGYYHKDLGIKRDFNEEVKAGKFFMSKTIYTPGIEVQEEAKIGRPVYVHKMGVATLSTGSITSTVNSISRTSKNPERAMMLINLMNSDKELFNLFTYGFENKHYEKISENRIRITDSDAYKQDAWMVGCQFNAYELEGHPENVWELTKEFNDSAIKVPAFGFVFDNSSVKTQKANVDAVELEYKQILNYGLVDNYEEILNEMNQKLLDAGILEIKAELERQLSEWKKSQ